MAKKFLPTPSRRGRHFYPRPRVEGDVGQLGPALLLMGFLPTPSRRGRRGPVGPCSPLDGISTHALA